MSTSYEQSVTVRLSKRIAARVDAKAKRDGTKRSEVVRRALKFFFDAEDIAKGK